jgi:peroxiredoxin
MYDNLSPEDKMMTVIDFIAIGADVPDSLMKFIEHEGLKDILLECGTGGDHRDQDSGYE